MLGTLKSLLPIIPSALAIWFFWIIVRALLQADRRERVAQARIEAAEDRAAKDRAAKDRAAHAGAAAESTAAADSTAAAESARTGDEDGRRE